MRFEIAVNCEVCDASFFGKPLNFILFCTPMDQNAIFHPWFWMPKKYAFHRVVDFCNTSHPFSWIMVPKRAVRETSRVACEREELSFLSNCSPIRLPHWLPTMATIAKLRTLDSYAFCTTIWVNVSLGSRTASGLACIDALLEQSG